MLNVPLPVLNALAPMMRSKTLQAICSETSEPKAEAAMLALARKETGSRNPMELQAFLQATLLLRENEAISRLTSERPDLFLLLPETLTVGEAAQRARADFLLTAPQTERLIRLLRKPLP